MPRLLRPQRITPPVEAPVPLGDMKAALREDDDSQDDLITSMIAGATDHLDGWSGTLGRCLVTQTWRFELAGLPRVVPLMMPDAQAVAATILQQDGSRITVDPADLSLREAVGGAELIHSGPAPVLPGEVDHPVRLDVTFGFGAAVDVPAPIVQAIRLIVGHMYARREAVADGRLAVLPMGVAAMLAPYRWIG